MRQRPGPPAARREQQRALRRPCSPVRVSSRVERAMLAIRRRSSVDAPQHDLHRGLPRDAVARAPVVGGERLPVVAQHGGATVSLAAPGPRVALDRQSRRADVAEAVEELRAVAPGLLVADDLDAADLGVADSPVCRVDDEEPARRAEGGRRRPAWSSSRSAIGAWSLGPDRSHQRSSATRPTAAGP
jgi:hypothetical protein